MEQLEEEKKENLKRIGEAEKILGETEKKKDASIGQLNAISQQIKSRESLIITIRNEVSWYDLKIEEDLRLIEALREDLDNLKKEYAAMVYASYKASQSRDKLTFLFSAASFNQMLLRLQYFEQYQDARRFQAAQILKVEESLQNEVTTYEVARGQKEDLIQDEIDEKNKLSALIAKQQNIVANLKIREGELQLELDNRRKAVAEISNLITRIIAEEAASATAFASTAALAELSTSFEGNKQRLPWPVSRGFISSGFGKQNHPVYKKVLIDNKGI